MTRTLEVQHEQPSPSHAPGGTRRNLLLLWVGQFVNTAGLMMLVPIMPFYLEQIGTTTTAETQTWAGVAIAAPALALTVTTPLWGRLGDRIGRKWMVVRALLGLAVAMLVMATAGTPLVLVIGRLLQGTLGGVVEAAAAFAGSTGSDTKRGSALGKSFSATAAGALAGPIAGGLLVGSGGLSQLMIVIAGAALLLSLACAIGLHEPEHGPAERTTSHEHRDERPSAMRVPGALPLALAAAGTYFGVYGLIPVFAEHVRGIVPEPHEASLWVGVLHSVMWGASLIGSFWWGKHNDLTQRPIRTFAFASVGCAASIAIVSLPLDPFALIPFRLVQGFCFAALAQSLFLHFSKHAPGENKSAFVSTANSYLLIGQSAGPLLAGPLVGLMPMAATIAVMAAMCGLGGVLALGPARAERGAADDVEDQPGAADATRPLRTLAKSSRGVSVVPFRGCRIAPQQLGALAARYATPWPRGAAASDADRTFRAWQRSGALIRDRHPVLYAYEQSGPHGKLRGVLGAVHLDSRLLPHEEVIPERVTAIAEVMHEASANLDPLLLGYSGDGRTTSRLAHTARAAPVSDVLGDDGQRHRLWHLTGHAQQEITDELATRAAFIADGHHRHSAARHLRREYYAAGSGPGPWDHVPALLVDTNHTPLQLGPVHRVLPRTEPRAALKAASSRFRIRTLHGDVRQWLTALKEHARTAPAFVIVTRSGSYLLSLPERPAATAGSPSTRHPHVAVLHNALISEAWQVPDLPEHITYETSATSATRQVQQRGGLAVLVTPPTHHDLRTAAANGLRLPRKSTSFGPQPHPGLVFRTLVRP